MTYSLCIEIVASIDTQTWFHSDSYGRNAWLLPSWLLYIWKREFSVASFPGPGNEAKFSDTNFKIGKPCRHSTEVSVFRRAIARLF